MPTALPTMPAGMPTANGIFNFLLLLLEGYLNNRFYKNFKFTYISQKIEYSQRKYTKY
jgi:hypothetical protein